MHDDQDAADPPTTNHNDDDIVADGHGDDPLTVSATLGPEHVDRLMAAYPEADRLTDALRASSMDGVCQREDQFDPEAFEEAVRRATADHREALEAIRREVSAGCETGAD